MSRLTSRVARAAVGIVAMTLLIATPSLAQHNTYVLRLHDFEGTGAWLNCNYFGIARDWLDTGGPAQWTAVSGTLEQTGFAADRSWYLPPAVADTMTLDGGMWAGSLWLSGGPGEFGVSIWRASRDNPCVLYDCIGVTWLPFDGSATPQRVDFELPVGCTVDLADNETLHMEIGGYPDHAITLWWDGQDCPSYIQTGPNYDLAPFDLELSTVVSATTEWVSVCTFPDGGGYRLDDCQTMGGARTDATITVTLIGQNGLPLADFPADNIWLETSRSGLLTCTDGGIADGNTDSAGRTTFSGPVYGGRQSDPIGGETTRVIVAGYPLVPPEFDIAFNSPDVDGNLLVDLLDVGGFASDFFGSYAYRSDFCFDGVINLADLAYLAMALGSQCPRALPATKAPADNGNGDPADLDPRWGQDQLGLYADPAGERATVEVAAGEPFDVHLLLKNPSAAMGIRGWECEIAVPENIRVLEWRLSGSAINAATPPEFVVGLGTPFAPRSVIHLATARCVATDERPAVFAVHGAQHVVPVYAPQNDDGATGLVAMETAAKAGHGVTFGVNTESGERSADFLPARVQLHGNAPNPFNPQTTIRYDLPRDCHVRLSVYTIDGHRLATLVDTPLEAGSHEVVWNGTDDRGRRAASGTYYYQLEAGGDRQTRAMVLLK